MESLPGSDEKKICFNFCAISYLQKKSRTDHKKSFDFDANSCVVEQLNKDRSLQSTVSHITEQAKCNQCYRDWIKRFFRSRKLTLAFSFQSYHVSMVHLMLKQEYI